MTSYLDPVAVVPVRCVDPEYCCVCLGSPASSGLSPICRAHIIEMRKPLREMGDNTRDQLMRSLYKGRF